MSSSPKFKPGDLVLCTDPGEIDGYALRPELVRGRAYKVKRAFDEFLYLVEFCQRNADYDEPGFYRGRFVKVDDVIVGTLTQEEI